MKQTLIKIFTIMAAAAALWGCSKVVDAPGESEEAVDLILSLDLPKTDIQLSKSLFEHNSSESNIVNDPYNPAAWSTWEQVVDGRFMYRLTVFVIDLSNYHLVGYRDIFNYGDSDGNGSVDAEELGDWSNTDRSVGPSKNGWYDTLTRLTLQRSASSTTIRSITSPRMRQVRWSSSSEAATASSALQTGLRSVTMMFLRQSRVSSLTDIRPE